MLILSDNGIEAKTRLNTDMIDSNVITVDGNMVCIPYNDMVLCEALGMLAFRLAGQNEWVFPDYDTVKTWLIVDTSGRNSVRLLVEVEPPRYTEQDKKELLHNASTEPIYCDSNITMRDVWCDIFKAAESFHSGNTGDRMDRTEHCYIDMTDAEEKRLQKFVDSLALAG